VRPSRSPFSYAVVRVVPDIEREEFLNAGLILFSRPRRFLAARTDLDPEALESLRPGCDADASGHSTCSEVMEAVTVPGAGEAANAPRDSRRGLQRNSPWATSSTC